MLLIHRRPIPQSQEYRSEKRATIPQVHEELPLMVKSPLLHGVGGDEVNLGNVCETVTLSMVCEHYMEAVLEPLIAQ